MWVDLPPPPPRRDGEPAPEPEPQEPPRPAPAPARDQTPIEPRAPRAASRPGRIIITSRKESETLEKFLGAEITLNPADPPP